MVHNIPLCVYIYIYIYIYNNVFIHSSVDGYLGCVHVLGIVNSAAMNNGIHVSFSILVSSGYLPRSGIALSYGGFIPSFFKESPYHLLGFPSSSEGKDSACNVGDLGSIPRLGRSLGERNGYPLQYSCLENPMERGAWQSIVHGSQRVRHP